ncbi:MAG: Gfo/Idh/MocA family protein [Halobacteriales archaeon]
MTLKAGFIGYAFMGKAHSNALNKLSMFFPDAPDVERHVIVGRSEDSVREAADQFGFENWATDWESVLDDIDVLYNLTPNDIHPEPSIEALNRDIHVMCEKPLAPTLEEAQAMAEAAADSDAIAGNAFNYRFSPAIQYARELIQNGELGELRQVRGHYFQDWLVDPEAPWSWRNDEEVAGSGALGDLGAHTLDLARFLVADQVGEVDRLSGHLKTFVEERPVPGDGDGGLDAGGSEARETRPVTVDDAYSAQVEFETGAMGTFEASRFATGHKNDHSVAVYGSEGALRFSLERLNELEVNLEGNRGFETTLVTDPDDPYYDHWWPPGHVIGWEHLFVHENYEFLTSVSNGTRFNPNFQDGLRVQELLEAVDRSDERGEWVSI